LQAYSSRLSAFSSRLFIESMIDILTSTPALVLLA
jgi:hypothetical protein